MDRKLSLDPPKLRDSDIHRRIIPVALAGAPAGFLFGTFTAIMRGVQGTHIGRLHILKQIGIFGIAGLVNGGVSYVDLAKREEDDYTGRFLAGCAAATFTGLANKSKIGAIGGAFFFIILPMITLANSRNFGPDSAQSSELKEAFRPLMRKEIEERLLERRARESS